MSSGIHKIDFSSPDEVRRPDKTTVEIIAIGNVNVARMTVQPGWVWSECIAPVAGTESCQAHHLGIVQSGQLLVEHEDGSTETISPGDVYECKPGHQAQVVGDEPCVDESGEGIHPLDLLLGMEMKFNENQTIGELMEPLLYRLVT